MAFFLENLDSYSFLLVSKVLNFLMLSRRSTRFPNSNDFKDFTYLFFLIISHLHFCNELRGIYMFIHSFLIYARTHMFSITLEPCSFCCKWPQVIKWKWKKWTVIRKIYCLLRFWLVMWKCKWEYIVSYDVWLVM